MEAENILLPEKWNEWTIVEKIGQGSYGTVYKAVRHLEGRELFSAVKIIDIPSDEEELRAARLEYDDDQQVNEYFQDIKNAYVNEIEVMFDLNGSPNIVAFEDFLVEEKPEIGWRIYIRMEYLEDFRLYNKSHDMTETEAVKLASDICNGLIYCEKKKIIHRDVKPENILRSPVGDYKLGDFGVARAVRQASGSFSSKGTYAYMAPEVVKGEHYSSNVDIYSLGIVLYRLMNQNRFPFENVHKQVLSYQEKEDALNRRMSGEMFPRPVLASDGFADIIMKACAYDPGQRYQSASEMASDLKNLGADAGENEDSKGLQSVQAPQTDQNHKEPEKTGSDKEKNRRPASYKIMTAFLVVAAAFAGFWGGRFLIRNFAGGDTDISATAEIQEEAELSDSDGAVNAADDDGSDEDTAVTVSEEEEVKEVKETEKETAEPDKAAENQQTETDADEDKDKDKDTQLYQVNATTLNVREEPDAGSKAVDVLRDGDTVRATGETSGGWMQVQYLQDENDDEMTGWVSGNYLSLISGESDEASETAENADADSGETEENAGNTKSSAENTAIYEEYKSMIDEEIDGFYDSSGLFTSWLSVGGEDKPLASIWGEIKCYSSDETVVTVESSGKVTAVGRGEAYVVIISTIGRGMAQTYKYIVS